MWYNKLVCDLNFIFSMKDLKPCIPISYIRKYKKKEKKRNERRDYIVKIYIITLKSILRLIDLKNR